MSSQGAGLGSKGCLHTPNPPPAGRFAASSLSSSRGSSPSADRSRSPRRPSRTTSSSSSDPAADAVLTEPPAAGHPDLQRGAHHRRRARPKCRCWMPPTRSSTKATPSPRARRSPSRSPPTSPNGEYRVLWKVVSGDGHPVSGELPSPCRRPEPCRPPRRRRARRRRSSRARTRHPPRRPRDRPPPIEEADASSTVPWVLLGIIAVAILGGVVYLLVSRARRRRETEAIRASQAGTPGARLARRDGRFGPRRTRIRA